MARVDVHSGWEDELRRVAEEHLLNPICNAIADDANRLAPVDTGALSHSYHKIESQDPLTKYVGSNLEYAAAVELGASPHVIEAKNSSVLTNGEGEFYGKKIMHPGNAPQPHLRPAVYRRRSI